MLRKSEAITSALVHFWSVVLKLVSSNFHTLTRYLQTYEALHTYIRLHERDWPRKDLSVLVWAWRFQIKLSKTKFKMNTSYWPANPSEMQNFSKYQCYFSLFIDKTFSKKRDFVNIRVIVDQMVTMNLKIAWTKIIRLKL